MLMLTAGPGSTKLSQVLLDQLIESGSRCTSWAKNTGKCNKIQLRLAPLYMDRAQTS